VFAFGNLMKESGVVDRLSDTTQNALINTVTIFLGLAVGSKLMADKFLQPETLAAIAEPITPATFGPMACINKKLCGSVSSPTLLETRAAIGTAETPAEPISGLILFLPKAFNRTFLKAKLHRVTTTASEVDYEGSCEIDGILLEAAGSVSLR
jgi:hypothetical protein